MSIISEIQFNFDDPRLKMTGARAVLRTRTGGAYTYDMPEDVIRDIAKKTVAAVAEWDRQSKQPTKPVRRYIPLAKVVTEDKAVFEAWCTGTASTADAAELLARHNKWDSVPDEKEFIDIAAGFGYHRGEDASAEEADEF